MELTEADRAAINAVANTNRSYSAMPEPPLERAYRAGMAAMAERCAQACDYSAAMWAKHPALDAVAQHKKNFHRDEALANAAACRALAKP